MNINHYFLYTLALGLIVSMGSAGNLSLQSKTEGVVTIKYSQSSLEIVEVVGYSRIVTPEQSTTTEEGRPELPQYTTFFEMKPGVSYSFEFEVISSHTIENSYIYPYQGEGQSEYFNKDIEFYSSNEKFPDNNLIISDPMIMRDIEVGLLSFIPYSYDLESKTLTVFDEVEIQILESGERTSSAFHPQKRSYLFEPFYQDLIIDYEPLSTREEYQSSAIMYICGGNSISHPAVQELISWRKKQGYIVYTTASNETGSSYSSITNYIDNAYQTFENPPEIVALIGDTGGSYSLGYTTYSGGDTDNPYAYIEGDDFLPEIFIGRISINSSTDIFNVLGKQMTYEKAENQSDEWYERAALVGDPSSSGISTITTMQYIQNTMENHGMDDIRTNYNNGNYNNWVDNQFSEGVLYYNYRGYYGGSSITSYGTNSGIYAPFAAILTCATGDFSGTSTSESFYRQGSPTDPAGAVACVGVSTIDTHTAYNNIVHMGIYEGIFSKGIYNAGAALANGKLSLLRTYPTNPNNAVSKFSAWPNLIGDPSLHLWTGKPNEFVIDAPSNVPSGTNLIDVTILDIDGNQIEEARVTIYLGDYYYSVYTDENGSAQLDFGENGDTEYYIAVFKSQFKLADASVTVGSTGGVAIFMDPELTSINDNENGNEDNKLNPGEIVDLYIPISNFGSIDIIDLKAELSTSNVNVEILSETQTIDFIASASESHWSFQIYLDASAENNENLGLILEMEDVQKSNWSFELPIQVNGPKLDIIGLNIDGNMVYPGQLSNGELIIHNSGTYPALNVSISLDDHLDNFNMVLMDENLFDLHPNETIAISLQIEPSEYVLHNSEIELEYEFETETGYSESGLLDIEVSGSREEGDPTGPDNYGYYIYDSGDIDYMLAVYDWFEIIGNGGSNLDLYDNGDGEYSGDTDVITLPFDFQFYGITYNEITISTNGWISFGDHQMSAFRNYSIPGAGGPSPMVAAFWDDLMTTNGGDVYYYSTDEYVIIEWDDMSIYGESSNQRNTFQIILYNTNYFPTVTGDGDIKIQYQDFNNISNGDYISYTPLHGCYSTIGIENHLGDDGIEYTFNNDYPEESMELFDGSAILISTQTPAPLPAPDMIYSASSFEFLLSTDETDSDQFIITNMGEAESVLNYSVNVSYPPLQSPFTESGGGPDSYGHFWSDSDINTEIDYNWIDISDIGEMVTFPSNDDGTDLMGIGFEFPFYGVTYSEFIINPNGWIGFDTDNDEWHNGNIPNQNDPKSAIFGFWDDLNPVNEDCNASCSGNVYYHNNNDRLVIWFEDVYHWTSEEYPNSYYDFQIVIYPSGEIDLNYRTLEGPYSATIGIQNQTGTVALQIDDYMGDYFNNQMSVRIKRADITDWLNVESENMAGELLVGESESFAINVDAAGLDIGEYSAAIQLMSFYQPMIEIPITLTVSESNLLVGDMNSDGVLDVLDIVIMVSWILDENEFTASGDINNDGLINVLDVVGLVQIILDA